jgi:hypothetical protein
MNNSPILFESLIRDHPQLTEKALIDFVNGLEVIDDHIHVRADNHFASRLWGQLMGESAMRQQVIDHNIKTSLTTVSTWLQCLQRQHIQSDLAITKVADKLSETRRGVMCLQKKHYELRDDVNKLLAAMDDMTVKHDQLAQRIKQIDDGRLATLQMGTVFDKWRAGRLNHYPVIVRLFLVFDELYWGEFGNYCRQCGLQHREIQCLIQQIQDKALIQLKDDWASEGLPLVYPWQVHTRQHLQSSKTEQREMIIYLTDNATVVAMPMLWALNQLASEAGNNLSSNQRLPLILTPQNAVNRFKSDFEERYANTK